MVIGAGGTRARRSELGARTTQPTTDVGPASWGTAVENLGRVAESADDLGLPIDDHDPKSTERRTGGQSRKDHLGFRGRWTMPGILGTR
jgi:hypothetical protein